MSSGARTIGCFFQLSSSLNQVALPRILIMAAASVIKRLLSFQALKKIQKKYFNPTQLKKTIFIITGFINDKYKTIF